MPTQDGESLADNNIFASHRPASVINIINNTAACRTKLNSARKCQDSEQIPIVQRKKIYFVTVLTALLVCGFLATSLISYFVAHDSLTERIAEESLPLTRDNIYSEIQRDLLQSILISSLMAHDTLVRDWTLGGEQDPDQIVRVLQQITDIM